MTLKEERIGLEEDEGDFPSEVDLLEEAEEELSRLDDEEELDWEELLELDDETVLELEELSELEDELEKDELSEEKGSKSKGEQEKRVEAREKEKAINLFFFIAYFQFSGIVRLFFIQSLSLSFFELALPLTVFSPVLSYFTSISPFRSLSFPIFPATPVETALEVT